jgi:hypothetical protein
MGRLVEEWKDVKGFEGLYQISNMGRVKSLARYKKNNRGSRSLIGETILKQSKNNRGYCRIYLCKDAHKKAFSVHRLVADAFVPNPNNFTEVNHKDEDKQNNCADNLEWCDSNYNINYGTHNKRISLTKGCVVQAFDKYGNFVMEFHSMSEAGRKTGIPQQNISRCISGKCETAGGYVWKKKSEVVKRGGVE